MSSITGFHIRDKLFGRASTTPPVGVGSTKTASKPPKAVRQAASNQASLTAGVEEKISAIEKRVTYLNQKVDNERKLAQAALKQNDQERAKSHLVTSRAHQKQIRLLISHKNNMRQQLIALETAAANREFVDTVGLVNNGIKANTMDIDQADEILADVAETNAQVNELSELTGKSIYDDPDTAVTEDDLADLMQDLEMDEPVRAPKAKKAAPPIKKAAPRLPIAPTHEVNVNLEEDEDEAALRALAESQ